MWNILLALIVLFFHGGFCQEPDIDLKLKEHAKVLYVDEGGSFNLTVTLNRDALFLLKNSIQWTHSLDWNNQTKSHEVATNAELLDEYQSMEDVYKAEFRAISGGVEFVVHFMKVRRQDDGRITVSLKTKGLKEATYTQYVDIVVRKPIETLALKFASNPIITKSPEEPIEVDVGKTYKLMCLTDGSNPAVEELNIHLGGQLLNLKNSGPQNMSGEFRHYQTTVDGNLTILTEHDNKYLDCEAQNPKLKEPRKDVRILLKVNTYDPHINCSEGEGYEMKMYVQVKCVVNATGIDVKKTYFRMSSVGKNLYEGTNNYKQDSFKVDKIMKNADLFELKMTINQAKRWHFDERWLIIVESAGNHVTEEQLKINRIPDETTRKPDKSKTTPRPRNGSTNSAASFVTALLLCILVRLL